MKDMFERLGLFFLLLVGVDLTAKGAATDNALMFAMGGPFLYGYTLWLWHLLKQRA